MNIAIVGAGINGISTALELARDGHQVTVFEQLNAAAEDASFAPGGWLTPCNLPTLAAPGSGMPLSALRRGAHLQSSGWIGSTSWKWLRQWKKFEKLAQQPEQASHIHALHTMADYSQTLRWESCSHPEDQAERHQGNMLLLRQRKDVNQWQDLLQRPDYARHTPRLLSAAQARDLEPGLSPDYALEGAVLFPQGESINPRLWTHHLRHQAQHLGVQIHTGAAVQQLHPHETALMVQQQLQHFDAIVLCTGAHPQLLEQAGLRLPALPLWGSSVTAPLRDALHAPRHALMDWNEQVTISRMGQRVRITAGAQLGHRFSTQGHHEPTLQRMYRLLNDWFPGGVNLSSSQVQLWRGARCILPDGLPAVGSTPRRNVWVNVAHGSHGVSLSSGCARALADLVGQRTPALDMQAFTPTRFTASP